jgi:hypothetical protein
MDDTTFGLISLAGAVVVLFLYLQRRRARKMKEWKK